MKRLKLIGCFVALAAIVGVNVWNATRSLRVSNLSIDNIEAMAQTEAEWFSMSLWEPTFEAGTKWDLSPTPPTTVINGQTYIRYDCMWTCANTLHFCGPANLAFKWEPI